MGDEVEPDSSGGPAGGMEPDPPGQSEPVREYSVEEVELTDVESPIAEQIARGEHTRALIGMVIGGLGMLAGVVLICLRVSGTVKLEFQLGDNAINLDTTVTGVVVLIVGLLIILGTRAVIKIDNSGLKETKEANG